MSFNSSKMKSYDALLNRGMQNTKDIEALDNEEQSLFRGMIANLVDDFAMEPED